MKSIKFTLKGKTAFFKKPEVNAYVNFTYGQIHKVALLGMFGAILGYGGYGQKIWKGREKNAQLIEEYPEFYERLGGIKISIVPRNEKGYIAKKIQFFNNSVGYASREAGGNLIIKEQWLENPHWDIYVLIEGEETEKLSEFLCKKRCVYVPYLGKNDHLADISEVEVVDLREDKEEVQMLSCLFPKTIGEISDEVEPDVNSEFRYEEKLPVGLNALTNFYCYDSFVFTNYALENLKDVVYQDEKNKLVFY